ncbi:MAG: hypothetical protein H6Q65_2921 [Firmicutes bacterium]|nr:hypothetical protein [Bacillota bacterium]
MARLEYRQMDENQTFPLLYYYEDIDLTEIAARFACDYFVKAGVTYEKTSCASQPPLYTIYVQQAEQQDWLDSGPSIRSGKGLRLELRQFLDNTAYFPEIHVFEISNNRELLLLLQSDYLYWLGQEWQKTSAEIDEDRQVYVYYAIPANGGSQDG